jgi:hypothetical protein
MKKIYHISKDYLLEHYVNQNKSANDICYELNIKSKTVIFRLLKKYNIPPNSKEGRPNRNTKKFGDIHQSYIYLIKNRAKNKNLDFNLTGAYLWKLFIKQNKKCALSGLELHFPKAWGVKSKTLITASLDRIDSNKGYIIGNVQWVHKTINTMKMNLTDSEFIKFCKKVAINHDYNLS